MHAVHVVLAVELHVVARAVLGAHDHRDRSVLLDVPDDVVALLIAQEAVIVVAHQERRDRVLEQEVLLVLAVLDDEVQHRHGKRRVRAWLDGDELVGEPRRRVEDEPDVDDSRPVAPRLDQVLGDALLVLDGVGAPDDDVVGAVEVRRVRGHVLVEIAHVEERGVERPVVETVALDGVRGAPQPHEAAREQRREPLARRYGGNDIPHRQRLRPVLVAQVEELLCYLVEGLVPGYLLPLALAAFPDALERTGEALGVVRLPAGHDALLADVALVLLRARVVRLLSADDLAVLDNGLDRAELVITPPRTTGIDERLAFRHELPFPFGSLV